MIPNNQAPPSVDSRILIDADNSSTANNPAAPETPEDQLALQEAAQLIDALYNQSDKQHDARLSVGLRASMGPVLAKLAKLENSATLQHLRPIVLALLEFGVPILGLVLHSQMQSSQPLPLTLTLTISVGSLLTVNAGLNTAALDKGSSVVQDLNSTPDLSQLIADPEAISSQRQAKLRAGLLPVAASMLATYHHRAALSSNAVTITPFVDPASAADNIPWQNLLVIDQKIQDALTAANVQKRQLLIQELGTGLRAFAAPNPQCLAKTSWMNIIRSLFLFAAFIAPIAVAIVAERKGNQPLVYSMAAVVLIVNLFGFQGINRLLRVNARVQTPVPTDTAQSSTFSAGVDHASIKAALLPQASKAVVQNCKFELYRTQAIHPHPLQDPRLDARLAIERHNDNSAADGSDGTDMMYVVPKFQLISTSSTRKHHS